MHVCESIQTIVCDGCAEIARKAVKEIAEVYHCSLLCASVPSACAWF